MPTASGSSWPTTQECTNRRCSQGLAFLVAGRIAVAASSQVGLLVRVDPANAGRLLAAGTAQPMRMKGRVLRGWLHIDSDRLRTKRQLAKWITIGTATAENIPAPR